MSKKSKSKAAEPEVDISEKYNLKTALDLAYLREYYRPVGSGPLGCMRVIFDLCTLIGKERGWDLEAAVPEALEKMREDRRIYEEEQKKSKKRKKDYETNADADASC